MEHYIYKNNKMFHYYLKVECIDFLVPIIQNHYSTTSNKMLNYLNLNLVILTQHQWVARNTGFHCCR